MVVIVILSGSEAGRMGVVMVMVMVIGIIMGRGGNDNRTGPGMIMVPYR